MKDDRSTLRGSPPSNSVEDSIAFAQRGEVNVTPDHAVEMAGALFGARKYGQAMKVCRQIIAARPDQGAAHNIMGVTLAALGKPELAIAALEQAIQLNGAAASYHANMGEVLRQAGRLDDAGRALRRAIKLDARHAQAQNNLGIVEFEKSNYQLAIRCYRRALRADPNLTEAYNNLGNACRMCGDPEGAVEAYEMALTQRSNYPEVYNNLGTLLHQSGRLEEAEHALRKAIQQYPGYVEAHNNLAALLFGKGDEVEALRILGDALKIAPKNCQTLLLTARVQLKRANFDACEKASRLALAQEPDNADALILLGQVLHETDRFAEALIALKSALDKAPESAEALNFYGIALKSVGRLEEAREHILKALQINRSMYGGYANLNDLVDFSSGIGVELFDQMEAALRSLPNPETEPFLALHFAYAKGLEDRGEHERALGHYVIGGRLKRAQLTYCESETHDFFDAIKSAFPKSMFDDQPRFGLDDERPVFIVGMPRSGSTLVEQILSSHPHIHGAGEVKYLARSLGELRDRFPFLPKYPEMAARLTPAQIGIVATNYQTAIAAGAGSALRVTDKLLTNYFFLGLIYMMFPKARVIHTRRDPVDTCLSAFTKLFKDDMPHSYDLAELGRYYAKYAELMAHWTTVLPPSFMTTVCYEDVVDDTEREARRLLDFLGLEWDDRCVEFHKSDRPVKTASVAQVRRPIYTSAVRRSRKYGDGLQPLVDAIERR